MDREYDQCKSDPRLDIARDPRLDIERVSRQQAISNLGAATRGLVEPDRRYAGPSAAAVAQGNGPNRGSCGSELNEQEHRLRALYELISELESVLTPVLTPQPPRADSAAKAPVPVGVLEILRQHNQMLDFLQARVQTILSRLEL